MLASDEYRDHMFRWLESIIKCELLGTVDVVSEPGGCALPRPTLAESPEHIHPAVRPPPRIADVSPSQFEAQYHTFVNELVEQHNWHEHRDTCWKYLRPGQPRTDENCRMRIDGSTRRLTELDPETLSVQLRRLHPRIANYNDLVIFLIQANMDVKHIGSGEGAKALIYYITDYITKASLPAHLGLTALMYAIETTSAKYGKVSPLHWTPREDTGALTVLVNSILGRTEISHQQVMSYLVGGGDHYTNHRFRLLYYAAFDRIVRRFWGEMPDQAIMNDQDDRGESPTDLPHASTSEQPNHGSAAGPVSRERTSEHDDDEDTITLTLANGSISAVNQQHDYLLRPSSEPFHSMPLYQFVGLTEKITCASDDNRLRRRTQ
ncbi:hypothetical protein K466DRAFT_461484, partial [Polyporus arcularius HHB13444]